MKHSRADHWFRCGSCGYVGTEDELPDDPKHSCGKDQCPDCKRENCITCCYENQAMAESDFTDDEPVNPAHNPAAAWPFPKKRKCGDGERK